MPILFLAHGAPMLLDDAGWVAELGAWARALPRPRAILMISAHWEQKPTAIGATTVQPLIYDFYGFPERFYELQYKSPGAPELAARVRALLDGAKLPWVDEPLRGQDHGSYVPLLCMYPGADIPVLQISLPTMDARPLYELGRALAPLAREDVLIIGSGFLTHNMRSLSLRQTPAWAHDFDGWCAETIGKRDAGALIDYRSRAPGVRDALPTHEHFVPVLVAAGAAESLTTVSFPITGFWFGGTFTRRSVQFG
jgi:4,5-DOPA dioxygenase extradiol